MKPYPPLTSLEAEKILKEVGANELPQDPKGRFFHSLIELFKEPMIILLFICSAIYLFIGQLHEALLLIASAV